MSAVIKHATHRLEHSNYKIIYYVKQIIIYVTFADKFLGILKVAYWTSDVASFIFKRVVVIRRTVYALVVRWTKAVPTVLVAGSARFSS